VVKRSLWVIVINLLYFSFIPLDGFVVYAQSNGDTLSPTTVAEEIIAESVAKGEIADLSILPDAKDRMISAEFFENLLTGKIAPISKKGVVIKDVTVDGNITLTNEVLPSINITECVFRGTVNFQGSKFDDLNFTLCTFMEDTKFNKTNIYDSADLGHTNFDSTVDFGFMTVGNNIDLNHSRFMDPQIIGFNSMKIGDSVLIDSAVFDGPVDFGYTRINGILNFQETQFNSPEESSFNSLVVNESIFFDNAIFFGPLSFGHSKIGANLSFSGVKFNSSDRLVFNSVGISGSLIFHDSFFSGPVFFLYIEAGNLMDFSRSRFSSELLARFAFLNSENGATFEEATFEGPVDFSYIDSNGSLNFDDTNFLNMNYTIEYSNLRTRGNLSLSRSSFYGGLTIVNANIEGSLSGKDIEFLTADRPVTVSKSDAHSLSFGIKALTNTIRFDDCTFLDFHLGGSKQNIKVISLSLSGTKVMQSFDMENLSVERFAAPNLMSFGNANLSDMSIEQLNLSFANFNNLIFQNVNWPKTPGNSRLDGFTYREIIPGETLNNNNWRELLNLINASDYNVALYKNLQSYFDNYGHSDWADEVLVAQKRRERSQFLKWYSVKWWWSFFLDGFVLYGRQPGRAFIWSLLIVTIGAIVFKKEKMIRLDKGEKSYRSLWYSLDLFIPFLDLGVSNKWDLSPKATGAMIYKRIHLILGWTLIPIALLSISGYFK
jgi:uncharacterized protein YjbI with pentapeptide repeats